MESAPFVTHPFVEASVMVDIVHIVLDDAAARRVLLALEHLMSTEMGGAG